MNTSEVQNQIKSILTTLGWSQKRLARELYMEEHDYDDEDEIKKYEEKLKKSLTRKTTKVELLLGYLSFLNNHSEFSEKKFVLTLLFPLACLNDEKLNEMKEFSKVVDKRIT